MKTYYYSHNPLNSMAVLHAEDEKDTSQKALFCTIMNKHIMRGGWETIVWKHFERIQLSTQSLNILKESAIMF